MSSRHQPKPPTDEQKAVLNSPGRVTVVRACPGAGKTEVFVEAIRQRLSRWTDPAAGLAALSFTNIARETIEARTGGAVQSPHFIGTLDAFVFRFIVKPFGHLVGLPAGKVRLFPAVISDHMDDPSISVGSEPHQRASIFSVHFSGLVGAQPTISTRLPKIGRFNVHSDKVSGVLAEKRRFWKGTGIVTHSDCHFLASSIVHHREHGAYVRQLLTRRFPVLCIDELQDTGCFLGRTFLHLFNESTVSGLVVGDPNQAIYGFGGASPTIFEDFEALSGAVSLPLNVSQRCPKTVSRLATALSASGVTVESVADAKEGRTTLLVHALTEGRLTPGQVQHIAGLISGTSLAVITRTSAAVRALKGDIIRDEFCGKSKSARRINIAVQQMLNGAPREAAQIIERELCRVVFCDEHANPEAVEGHTATRAEWRAAIFGLLMTAAATVKGETWNGWVERVKGAVRDAAVSLGWVENGQGLRSFVKCNKKGIRVREELFQVAVTPLWKPTDVVTTIHKVKGAEYDTVLIFVRKPHKNQTPCPSTEWWPVIGESEEKRIAFVAVTRAKHHLILCVHAVTHEALKATRPGFLALFDEIAALP
ncbi:MAG: ATP-dependent helicase UvrD/PcrA [Verrucomicrobiota bacterium]|jgi:DNA helicase-2/ATP-dependent DNA helicase PcrA